VSHQCAFIGVEGAHDQTFIRKVLEKALGFTVFGGKQEDLAKINPVWTCFIPSFPRGGDLYKRLDMPSILHKGNLSVAIYDSEGKDGLIGNTPKKLKVLLSNNPELLEQLIAFAIIADADKDSVVNVARSYSESKRIKSLFPDFTNTQHCLGQVIEGIPRLGLYILPNNKDQGVVDTIICQCGEAVYSDYMKRADDYLKKFSNSERLALGWGDFSLEKARIATVASILKPGRANAATISDNDWVSEKTLTELPDMQQLIQFLRDLLEPN